MSKVVLEATVEGISTRQDNTFKIVIGTQEIDKSMVAELFDFRNKFIKVLFSDTNITEMEAGIVDSHATTGGVKIKSKAQRLRNVLWRVWEHSNSGVDFDTYYDQQMEAIIVHYKTKLDPQ